MNVTETDVAVAASFYPILVACARQTPPRLVTYGELISIAKAQFPTVDAVQSAIPVSVGRRLDVVRLFLSKEGLPDLTSLVVNASTGEVGDAFGSDPETARAAVAGFDWSAVETEFNLHLAGLRKQAVQRSRPKLSRDAAKKLMADYYREHQRALPKHISTKREDLIKMIEDGVLPEEAFQRAAAQR